MKLVSFNINGLRAHIHQLEAIICQLKPDIIGLQETKVHDDLFPIQQTSQYGYNIYYHGQKKNNGVALLLKKEPLKVIQGLSNNHYYDHSQKRIIMADIATPIGTLTIINSYCPQGHNKNDQEKFKYKKNFYKNLKNYIELNYKKNSLLLIMGDMNISPTELDIGLSEKNKQHWISSGKCSFLPEEKQWIQQLLNWGLIDIYRYTHPTNNTRFSWFDYRSQGFYKNKGLRIDLILITHPLIRFHKSNGINYNIRSMNKPSDHAPVWIDLNI